jgi:hypothetical protein
MNNSPAVLPASSLTPRTIKLRRTPADALTRTDDNKRRRCLVATSSLIPADGAATLSAIQFGGDNEIFFTLFLEWSQ